MHHLFSIEESINFGWEKTKEQSRLIFQVVLTVFALQVLQSIITKTLDGTFIGIAATIVLVVVSVVLSTGTTIIALNIARGKPAHYSQLMPSAHLVWWYVCVSIVSGVIIVLGFILLIIPGIYLALRFSMSRFAVIDGAEILESLSRSTSLTEGVKWQLLGFFIVIAALNIVGALLLLVGLLITLPVSMIAYAHIYQKLLHHHSEAK